MSYSVRNASLNEVQLLLDWATEEGWNPGLNDQIPFHVADPSGFFIGCLDGVPIAGISAVRYSAAFGFVGLYIVKKEFRGRGYGIRIWQHAVNYLQQCNIGLDGVVAQQENYKKFGFELYYRNIRYAGSAIKAQATSLTPLNKIPFDSILQYDTTFFSIERAAFLSAWVQMAKNAFAYAE